MGYFLIVFAAIIFTCTFLNKVSSKIGVPVLLLFLLLGFLSGWAKGPFDVDGCKVIENVCTVALIFIMFYGGFGTRWSSAKPVVVESGLLATVGVLLTAFFVGLFCHFIMKWGWAESLLMGSVISSTDAATVFSILRSKKMGLKNNTAPILEMESGSNDPCSYMLTAVMLSVLGGSASAGHVVWMVFAQLVFGAGLGFAIAKGAVYLLRRFSFGSYNTLFILAVAIFSYGLPAVMGGNGYLSTYIVGIILGNTEFRGRKPMVNFFDAVTSLMQILIFFLLGYMAMPSNLLGAILPALAIFVFITLIGRPLAVTSVLAPFRKYPLRQIGLVSFVGLRGAASIVFAIMTLTRGASLEHDVFSIVFCLVILSISLQGSLIPHAAQKLKMIDASNDVMRTFSDFGESLDMSFGILDVQEGDPWQGRRIMDLNLPKDMIITMIVRGGESIVPNGSVSLEAGDRVITCSKSYQNETEANLLEHPLSPGSRWIGKQVRDYPAKGGKLFVLIKRGNERIIPKGDTVFCEGDVLVTLDAESLARKS